MSAQRQRNCISPKLVARLWIVIMTPEIIEQLLVNHNNFILGIYTRNITIYIDTKMCVSMLIRTDN
jgi:hypothetical protein